MSNFQHPGDWESPLHDVVESTLDPLERLYYNGKHSASVGYLRTVCDCDCDGHGHHGHHGHHGND